MTVIIVICAIIRAKQEMTRSDFAEALRDTSYKLTDFKSKEEKMANLIEAILDGKKGIGLFLGGVLMGTAGIRILTSDDARKVYVQGTAAALRGKEEVMTTATALRENCGDIYAEALEVNEKRAEEKAADETGKIIEDMAEAKA